MFGRVETNKREAVRRVKFWDRKGEGVVFEGVLGKEKG